ncbi:MAG: GNAT family N-acetyltransferase [Lachnospiraceae bacterium]|nr:GNAT family N-acetyltransferase [Lachnospiraceae bacterium]
MEQVDNQNRIDKICTDDDRKREELFLRELWRECFNDPKTYEDFYFTRVYGKNTVYTIKGRGMVHLNPYVCKICGREKKLHYIVGVGTHFSQRRKGIMRQLLRRAFIDMYANQEPFTYLMPADVRYYEPFGFFSISERTEMMLARDKKQPDRIASGEEDTGKQDILYMDYMRMQSILNPKEQKQLYNKIDYLLETKYHVFAKHDALYFELLAEEKACQNGDVVFCFERDFDIDNLLGFFAYSMEEAKAYVEQNVFDNNIFSEQVYAAIRGYIQTADRIQVIERFPFMVRIIDVLECIKLYSESFYSYAVEKKKILISDDEIFENNGIYSFFLKENQVFVQKRSALNQDKTADGVCMEWDMRMTIAELTDILFGDLEKDRVFFAEIV